MTVRFQRLIIIIMSLAFLGGAITLILINYKNNLVFFYTPSELIDSKTKLNQQVRLGGYIKSGSLIKNDQNNYYKFIITDYKNEITIEYMGILPDLFKEKQGAVIEGKLIDQKKILAEKVFAKHDENYMPSSIKNQLEKAKYWKKNY